MPRLFRWLFLVMVLFRRSYLLVEILLLLTCFLLVELFDKNVILTMLGCHCGLKTKLCPTF